MCASRLIRGGRAYRRIFHAASRRRGGLAEEERLELRRPARTEICVGSVDQNISSTVEGRRLSMAEARA